MRLNISALRKTISALALVIVLFTAAQAHGLAPPLPFTNFTPANSAELVTALATAVGGDTISLDPNVVYTGPFILRSGLASVVTIKALVAPGTNGVRIPTPTGAPVILCGNSNNQKCFETTGNNADNWRITGIVFRQKTGIINQEAMIKIGNHTETVAANMPNNIEIDHCWIQADEPGTTRGLFINGSNISVHDNVVIGFRINGQECQGILYAAGPGPVTIDNNLVSGLGENVLTGGVPVGILAANLTLTRNYLFTPQIYNPWNPAAFDIADAATTTALPCTVSSTGTTVTCTGHGLPVDPGTLRVIQLTSGPQSGERRTLFGVSNTNTFSIQTPFSTNQSSVTATVYGAFGHKNGLEFKVLEGTSNLVEGNVIDGSWLLGQDGVGLVTTVRTEDNALPNATIKNLTIQYNYFKRFNGWLRIISPDDFGGGSGIPISNVTYKHNVIEWLYEFSGPGTQAGSITNSVRFGLLNGPTNTTPVGTNLWIQHLTLYSPLIGTSFISFVGGMGDWVGFKLENSVVATQTSFGIFADGGLTGTAALDARCNGAGNYSAVDNVFLNQNVTGYPAGSFSEASVAAIGLADVANANFQLTSGPYRAGQARQASDGTDRGADITTLSTKIGASTNSYATATIKAVTGNWGAPPVVSGGTVIGGKVVISGKVIANE